jgi:mono/diheme cytochrome c family protein
MQCFGVPLMVLLLAVSLCACAAPAKVAAPAASGSAGAANTAAKLADAGQAVYGKSCASCHGAQGQGGSGLALIGAGNGLAKYETGQGLYKKISSSMPRGAGGSLSAAEYQQVTAYILLQNKLVAADTVLDDAALAALKLK